MSLLSERQLHTQILQQFQDGMFCYSRYAASSVNGGAFY